MDGGKNNQLYAIDPHNTGMRRWCMQRNNSPYVINFRFLARYSIWQQLYFANIFTFHLRLHELSYKHSNDGKIYSESTTLCKGLSFHGFKFIYIDFYAIIPIVKQ